MRVGFRIEIKVHMYVIYRLRGEKYLLEKYSPEVSEIARLACWPRVVCQIEGKIFFALTDHAKMVNEIFFFIIQNLARLKFRQNYIIWILHFLY